jgi:superfamily II DNA or RNA helicase
MARFLDLIRSCDSNPAKRGRQFELFVCWFLKNDPQWATQVAEVWMWDDYPDRWGVDCGIDIIFKHRNGETWAVQAKCYSVDYDVTKQDIDKFLSESNRKCIDKRLLIATTDRIGANARQVCEAQEKPVVCHLLSNFEAAFVEYPQSITDLHRIKAKDKPQPRPHQVDAIKAVVRSFQDTDRGQLIMACGTGKTFTTLWIKEGLLSTSTLVLLPSLGLLSQTLHEWTAAATDRFEVLCVCSDQSVGKSENDEAVNSVFDLAFPVTSDISEIQRFLRQTGFKVIFSTYQSSPLVADAQAGETVPEFDLVVADEAHRCAGKTGNDFSTVLDSNRIRAKKRLFATATPRTYSTNVRKIAEGRGISIVGMDDQTVFGKVLYALPFGEAIKRGLLTDYRVVIVGVDNPTIADWIQRREIVTNGSGIENDAHSLAAQIGLLKAFKDYDLKRVISFHSRVSRAEIFAQEIQQIASWMGDSHKPSGAIKTDFVSGLMSAHQRRARISQLKSLGLNERGLLANARCLSEGVDVPSLDGVAFIDPRGSQIDIIQAVGRAIRLSQNKIAGTIVLPVFIADFKNPTASIEESNFKPIWDVLNALKAHDDILSDELDQLRTELGRSQNKQERCDSISKLVIDLPRSADESFVQALKTVIVEQTTAPWFEWYGLLKEYVLEHGDALVSIGFKTARGKKLGQWVSSQRQIRHRLMVNQVEALEALNGWSWTPRDDEWSDSFELLKEYVIQNGHAIVPDDYRTPTGYGLGNWVTRQRVVKKRLSSEKIQLLESIDGWVWDAREAKWMKGYQSLIKYVRHEGNAQVPDKFITADGFPLGNWVGTNRLIENSKSAQRKQLLEKIPGWTWNPFADQWMESFEELAQFVIENGHSNVPVDYLTPSGFALGRWVQKQKNKSETLTNERREYLEEIPGWSWNRRHDKWYRGFDALKSYIDKNGNCNIAKDFVADNGTRLGEWVRVQKFQWNRKGKGLSQELREKLLALPEWVSYLESK